MIWNVDHYAPCEFLMTIFGPAVEPRIVINGHPYQIYTTLDENEYLQIDSRNNQVIKYLANGIQQDIYDLRAKREREISALSGLENSDSMLLCTAKGVSRGGRPKTADPCRSESA